MKLSQGSSQSVLINHQLYASTIVVCNTSGLTHQTSLRLTLCHLKRDDFPCQGKTPLNFLLGAPRDTIYNDAVHFWTMDSTLNIINLASEKNFWGEVNEDINEIPGVNGMAIELAKGNIKVLNKEECLVAPRVCDHKAITMSLLFTCIDGALLFRTSSTSLHTGLQMSQGDSPGHVIFDERRSNKHDRYEFQVEPNIWLFFTFTLKNSTSRHFFINAEHVVVTKSSSQFSFEDQKPGKLVIGDAAQFDDFAIWYRALTDREIERVYNYYYKGKYILFFTEGETRFFVV